MPTDIIIVFALVVVAVALFISERLPIGLVAVTVMVALMLTGVLTPEEGFSGFSSRATVTIAAMFMLSEGVRRTGVLDRAGALVTTAGRDRPARALLAIMLVVGAISAFINNTAAIAIFIPVILAASERLGVSASRLLMPASFASMLGGSCTLIGTSTNILVSNIAADHGLRPLGMFELAPVGLVFAGLGVLYLMTAGRRLVPARRSSERLGGGFELNEYFTDVVVLEDSDLVGRTVAGDPDLAGGALEVVDVLRDGSEQPGRVDRIELAAGDVLRIHGPARRISDLVEQRRVELRGVADWRGSGLQEGGHALVEAVVAPDSPLARRRIRDADFGERLGAVPLAVQHRGSLQRQDLGDVRLQPGDCVLLAVDADRVGELPANHAVVLVNRVPTTTHRRRKAPVALAVLAGVVAATALDLAPVAVNALAGVVMMVLTGCLDLEEGVAAVNWEVIFLLAGMIPLGLAMEKTGAAALLAEGVVDGLGAWGPQAVLSGLFLLTILLTSVLNNQAAAVLLSPMVIELAGGLGADPRPFLIAVTYGASLSFITPVGYQTNTMIYGPGQYRFSDFLRVGAGLNLLLWLAGTLLIPVFWPLTP